ncbi:MAG: ribonuclease P protein component 1 [Methanotrichaceae archaeon]|nr:ribonuclease P protein component 1 [Methanotrichaceae archaeon]
MITPENLARHELVGLDVEAEKSPGLAHISGRVIDETRNTFLIETELGEKRVPKSHTSFIFTLPNGSRVKVSGSILISQPENRIQKRMQRARWKI